ncbi:hypothetical protein [Bacillus marasmi]|uniref:hypothetical protein n=1 Tax=Bacillus marasmi TaxID=1926279 RepID=UPI0011CAC9E3|nr:hypothetical protein [Bacillus marasmi]
MESNTFINNSVWTRQQYEISNEHGIDYIIIKRGSEKAVYEPLNQEILYSRPKNKLEHLKSSPHVALSRIDPNNYEDILFFVNTWGLLGLKHVVKYNEINLLAELLKIPHFGLEFPEIRELYRDRTRRRGERDREPLLVFQQAIRDYQQIITELVKYRDYKLPIEFYSKGNKKDFIEKMSQNEGPNYPGENNRKRKAIENEVGKALVPFLKLNEMVKDVSPQIFWNAKESKGIMGWRFTSLLSANYLRLLLDFGEGKSFTHCKWKNCRKPFIPRNPANQYCDDKCRNSDNTYRHKLNIWLGNIKSEFPNRNEQEIENIFYSLIEDGLSGEKKILKRIKQILD